MRGKMEKKTGCRRRTGKRERKRGEEKEEEEG